jgi:hypothetical protein
LLSLLATKFEQTTSDAIETKAQTTLF